MPPSTLSLWQPFGLRSSPFFQDPLEPSDTAERPISLFVGRRQELARLTRRILSDTATRTLIEGDAGIGKTSFVNRIKADVAIHGVASHENPIRITSDLDWRGFVRESLRAVLRTRLGLGLDNTEDPFWHRTVLLLEGGELRTGGASALGVGASLGRTWVSPQVPSDSLYEHLGEALSRLKQESPNGVLLHVNNLDNQALEHADALAILLRDLRDYFLLDGAHWVFVGIPGIEASVFRRYDQVGGIIPSAEVLLPLSPENVSTLLQERYEYLGITGQTHTPPVEPETAARLYALYRGDLRNFLRLLSEAAERLLGIAGVRPMRYDEILSEMAPQYTRLLQRTVSETDWGYLTSLVRETAPAHEFRVTDVAAITGLSQGAASDLVRRLTSVPLLTHLRTEGRSTYYAPLGTVMVAIASAGVS